MKKNLPNIFDICAQHGSINFAISNAIRRERFYNAEISPSKRDPGTTVYKLVKELIPYITPLIK